MICQNAGRVLHDSEITDSSQNSYIGQEGKDENVML